MRLSLNIRQGFLIKTEPYVDQEMFCFTSRLDLFSAIRERSDPSGK